MYIWSVQLRSAGLLLKGKPALDFTRYLIGLATLAGFMLVSLLCAHLIFKWVLSRQHRCKKTVEPGPVE